MRWRQNHRNAIREPGLKREERILTDVIGALLKQVAAREPDTVAFVDGDRRLTYAEWDWLSDRAAFSLWEEGIRPGETVRSEERRVGKEGGARWTQEEGR